MVFATVRHGNAIALHGVLRAVMVFRGNAVGVPWPCHGVSWCCTARVLMAGHELHLGIVMVPLHGIATE